MNIEPSVMNENSSVFWIDDHLSSFFGIKKLLEKKGHRVVEAQDVNEVNDAKVTEQDRFIIDNKMSEEHLNFGVSLYEKLLQEPNKRIVLFSAYLSVSQIQERIRINPDSGSVAIFIPKEAQDVSEIESYNQHIAQTFDAFFRHDLRDIENSVRFVPSQKDALSTFSEFSALTFSEKSVIYEDFERRHRSKIEELFAQGVIWLVFFGENDEPEATAFRKEEVWSARKIRDHANYNEQIPFIFRNDIRVDTTGCVAASEDAQRLQSYPHVALRIKNADVFFHFDTGADTTFFNEKFIAETGGTVTVTSDMEMISLQGTMHTSEEIVFQALCNSLDEESAQEKLFDVEINARVIGSWEKSRLFVKCSSRCSWPGGQNAGCFFRRNGLVGRDFYIDNGFKVILDCRSPRAKFLKIDDED